MIDAQELALAKMGGRLSRLPFLNNAQMKPEKVKLNNFVLSLHEKKLGSFPEKHLTIHRFLVTANPDQSRLLYLTHFAGKVYH